MATTNSATTSNCFRGQNPFQACGMVCGMLGVFLLIPGSILTNNGYDYDSIWNKNDFFDDTQSMKRTVGPILLTLGLIFLLAAFVLCACGCKNRAQAAYTGQVLTTTTVTTTNYQPVAGGVHASTGGDQQQAYQQQTYPTTIIGQSQYPQHNTPSQYPSSYQTNYPVQYAAQPPPQSNLTREPAFNPTYPPEQVAPHYSGMGGGAVPTAPPPAGNADLPPSYEHVTHNEKQPLP